jgi:hypothetical protein
MSPVIRLDPRPANDAVASVASANPGRRFLGHGQLPRRVRSDGRRLGSRLDRPPTPTASRRAAKWAARSAWATPPRLARAETRLAGQRLRSGAFSNGGHLVAEGLPSVSADGLTLTASNIPGPGLFFQANGLIGAPATLGDGKLCAGISIVRMGVVFPSTSAATYPGGLTPAPIHIAGAPVLAGDTKYYQCWYRSVPGLCSASNFNLSQGVQLTWQP